MTARKVSESKVVAYVDDLERVEVAGFYIMEGDETESTHMSQKATKTATAFMEDDEGKIEFQHPVEMEDDEEYTTKHQTTFEPVKQVWPSPDGEGWVTEEPPQDSPGMGKPSKVVLK